MRKKTSAVKRTPSLPNHNYSTDDVVQIRRTIYGMNMASPSPDVNNNRGIHSNQIHADYERGWSSPKTPYSVISRDANNTKYNDFADRYGLANSMKVDSSPIMIDARSKQVDISMSSNNNNSTYSNYNTSSINPSFATSIPPPAYKSSPFSAETLSQLNNQQQYQQQQQHYHQQQHQQHHHQQQQQQQHHHQQYQHDAIIDHAKQAQSLNNLQPEQSSGIDQLADWISAVNNVKQTTPNYEYGILSRENPFPSSSLSSALKPFIEDDDKYNATLVDKHTSPKRTANIIKEAIRPTLHTIPDSTIADPTPDLTYDSLNLNQYDSYINIPNDDTTSLNVETDKDLNELNIESEAATETNFINSYCYYYDEDKKLKKMPHYVTHRIQLAHQEFERYLAKGRTQTLNSLQKTLKQGADAHVDILKKTLEKREVTLMNERMLKNLDESLVQLISKRLLVNTDRIFNIINDNDDDDIREQPSNESDEFISYLNNRIESTLLEIKSNSLRDLETEMLAVASSKLESVQREVDDRREYWTKQIEKDVAAVHDMKRASTQKELDGHWKTRMKKFLGATTGDPYNNKDIDIDKESDVLLARERKKIKKILGYMDHLFSKIDKASISINAEDAIIKSKSFSTHDNNNDDDDKPHVRVSKKIEKKDEALRVLRQMASIVELSLNKQETLAKSILTETMELKAHLLK